METHKLRGPTWRCVRKAVGRHEADDDARKCHEGHHRARLLGRHVACSPFELQIDVKWYFYL